MTSIEERGAAFEAKFAHDAELQFKVEARRDKIVGLWAASILGHTGTAADTYVAGVIKSDLEEVGDLDVFRKLVADLGTRADEDEIRSQMAMALKEAKAQILDES